MKYWVLGLFILLAGCEMTEMTGKAAEIIPIAKEDNFEYSIYFCPRENCAGELASFITSAKKYVHCAFFDLDEEKVINALKKQTVDVKVVVDKDNYEIVEKLEFVKPDTKSRFSHNKFCIVDGEKISTGSMNPTKNGVEKNNNNLIIMKSKYIAMNYEDEFKELWNGTFGKGEKVGVPIIYLDGRKVENYFCPEDSCSEQIIRVLGEAEKSIKFMTFSYTHEGIANTMLIKNKEGIEIKGVFEKTGAGSEYSKYKVLKYQGADVRKDNNSATMHHKVFIIDESIVITGSFNPSANADTGNDENILIIYDSEVAADYLREFEYVWENFTS